MKRIGTHKYKPLLNAITILVGVQLGVYVYSASLPYMQQDLHTTAALINNTLTVFVFAIGISQLFIGPMSDRYENKKLILILVSVLFLSSFCISLETNIYIILFLRGIQGFSGGGLSILAKNILKNNYASDLTKYIAIYSMASTFIPAFSPFLGGILQNSFSWRAVFLFISAYLFALFVYFLIKLPKTNIDKHASIKTSDPNLYFFVYFRMAKSFTFMMLSLCNAIIFYIEMMELTFSSFIIQVNYHISPISYGAIMAIPAMGFIIGSFLVIRNKGTFSDRQLILIGIYTSILSCLLLAMNVVLHFNSVPLYVTAITITNIGLAVSLSPIAAKAFTLFPEHISGSAIAFTGFLQMVGASMLAYIINKFTNMTQSYFTIILISLSIILFISIKSIYKKI